MSTVYSIDTKETNYTLRLAKKEIIHPIPDKRDVGGYLSKMPDMLRILPPPPSEDSDEWDLDMELSKAYLKVSEKRKKRAEADAILQFPRATDAFNIILNDSIDPELTPSLYRILQRTCVDGGRSTGVVKRFYKRPRPFMINQLPTLTPWDEEMLITDGSYPSGHTAIGWIWALVLADIFPSHSLQILNRGYQFGVSRNICNVHWHSDVIAGRACGTEVVTRLYLTVDFVADLNLAREEIKLLS